MREFLEKYRPVVIVVAVIVLVVAVVRLRTGKTYVPGQQYYFDLTENKLFPAPWAGNPIASPSGNPAYHAHVFSCGACKEGEQFVGYIVKPAETLETVRQNDPTITPEAMPPAPPLVAVPQAGEEPQWLPSLSPAGAKVMNVASRCSGSLQQCLP